MLMIKCIIIIIVRENVIISSTDLSIVEMSYLIYLCSKSLLLISFTNISWGEKVFFFPPLVFYITLHTWASCPSLPALISLCALIVFCRSDWALSTMIKQGSNHASKAVYPPSLQLVLLARFQKNRSRCARTLTWKAEEEKIRKMLQSIILCWITSYNGKINPTLKLD